MKFLSVRELRTANAGLWQTLDREAELVVTSNGKPVALLTPINDQNLEVTLQTFRRARALAALQALHKNSLERGLDATTMEAVVAEIQSIRQVRNAPKTQKKSPRR